MPRGIPKNGRRKKALKVRSGGFNIDLESALRTASLRETAYLTTYDKLADAIKLQSEASTNLTFLLGQLYNPDNVKD